MGKALIIIFFCLTIISGCSKTETISPEEKKTTGEEKPLLIGLIPEQNIFKQLERYKPLADYLSKKTGRKIELKVLTRYGNSIDNFASMGLDGAFFGSFTYTLAHAKLGVDVLARPLSINGTSTYHGLIFVRKDSGIKTAKDMKGKTFAFVDKATTAGYLLPVVYFKKHGIENYKIYLKETYFTGTHDDAIYDVLNRKADIGAAKNTVYDRLANIDSRIKNELVILERSPDVPENGLAIREDLDSSIKNKLKEALLNMHNDAEGTKVLKDFGATRFIETVDDDYTNVYKYAKQINLNLATYDYIKD
ncbi:MAG: phosphate/phosphite/phosphonate ABC transporter substrate-binding protein [Candidatus Roizmanbacteria bacterium]|nr:phosphate/phosphite/phosphonate ABC transporter substrate-binding protein [Candidatus Roizmanbacteria bacterium]